MLERQSIARPSSSIKQSILTIRPYRYGRANSANTQITVYQSDDQLELPKGEQAVLSFAEGSYSNNYCDESIVQPQRRDVTIRISIVGQIMRLELFN